MAAKATDIGMEQNYVTVALCNIICSADNHRLTKLTIPPVLAPEFAPTRVRERPTANPTCCATRRNGGSPPASACNAVRHRLRSPGVSPRNPRAATADVLAASLFSMRRSKAGTASSRAREEPSWRREQGDLAAAAAAATTTTTMYA